MIPAVIAASVALALATINPVPENKPPINEAPAIEYNSEEKLNPPSELKEIDNSEINKEALKE